jgi:hypothetical protein
VSIGGNSSRKLVVAITLDCRFELAFAVHRSDSQRRFFSGLGRTADAKQSRHQAAQLLRDEPPRRHVRAGRDAAQDKILHIGEGAPTVPKQKETGNEKRDPHKESQTGDDPSFEESQQQRHDDQFAAEVVEITSFLFS